MSTGHDHGVASLAQQNKGRLAVALTLTATVMLIQIIGGVWSHSLSLVSDAAHMGTDALGIGMALVAVVTISKATVRPTQTFGLYRLEVLSALANTALLFGVSVWVIIASIIRLWQPPQIESGLMLAVACVGLVANLISLLILRSAATESINIRGAYLEVLGDLIGSAGVIIAAVVIWATGWWYADPIVAIGIGAFILPRAWRLGRETLRILLQTAPDRLDLSEVSRTLGQVNGVCDVHDLHVWTLTSGMDVASAHLTIRSGSDLATVLTSARESLHDEYRIDHATLQVEPARASHGCQTMSW